jgi:hypothetical protein
MTGRMPKKKKKTPNLVSSGRRVWTVLKGLGERGPLCFKLRSSSGNIPLQPQKTAIRLIFLVQARKHGVINSASPRENDLLDDDALIFNCTYYLCEPSPCEVGIPFKLLSGLSTHRNTADPNSHLVTACSFRNPSLSYFFKVAEMLLLPSPNHVRTCDVPLYT